MAISNSDNAGIVDFVCRRGDTFTRVIEVLVNNTPVDFTGSTLKMNVVTDFQTILSLSSGSGIDVSANIITITASAAIMAAITPGIYQYDLQQTYPDGTVKTFLEGSFTINKDKTI
jgi:hypothetical protein